MVVIDQIDTGGTVFAPADAVVQILGTGWTAPALQAAALERSGQVPAGLGVYARSQPGGDVRFALVYVCFQRDEKETFEVMTFDLWLMTLTDVAGFSRPLRGTFAAKLPDHVDAGSAVLTGSFRAFVNV